MSILNMPEEEKAAIRKQHEEATKKLQQKIADQKAGLAFKKPEKPAEEKPVEKPKEEKTDK